MLHDLFLLSEYFDPPFAYHTERDLIHRYGAQAVFMAFSQGFIERRAVPCPREPGRSLCVLSQKGRERVRRPA